MPSDLLKLPNFLTLLRLAAVPWTVHYILAGRGHAALAVFVFAAITDALDGFLARRLRQTSRAGAYFDPLTDKIFLSASYLALAASTAVPWWLVALIFGRDLGILLGVAVIYTRTGRRDFPPSLWGKISTLFQSCFVIAVLFTPAARPLIWPVAVITTWSGIDYFRRGVAMLSPVRSGTPNGKAT